MKVWWRARTNFFTNVSFSSSHYFIFTFFVCRLHGYRAPQSGCQTEGLVWSSPPRCQQRFQILWQLWLHDWTWVLPSTICVRLSVYGRLFQTLSWTHTLPSPREGCHCCWQWPCSVLCDVNMSEHISALLVTTLTHAQIAVCCWGEIKNVTDPDVFWCF